MKTASDGEALEEWEECFHCRYFHVFFLRCGTRPNELRHPMRLEIIRKGLQVELATHYTTQGANFHVYSDLKW